MTVDTNNSASVESIGARQLTYLNLLLYCSLPRLHIPRLHIPRESDPLHSATFRSQNIQHMTKHEGEKYFQQGMGFTNDKG